MKIVIETVMKAYGLSDSAVAPYTLKDVAASIERALRNRAEPADKRVDEPEKAFAASDRNP